MELVNQTNLRGRGHAGDAVVETYRIEGDVYRIVTGLENPQGICSVIHIQTMTSARGTSISEAIRNVQDKMD